MVTFYTQHLGLRLLEQADRRASLTVDGVTPLVSLIELPEAKPKPAYSTGLYHFALLHPTRADLARTLAHLLAQRYPLQGASDHGVSEAIYLADPEGNGIEIYVDRPRSAWPIANGALRMVTDRLDVENLLAEADGDRAWVGLPVGTTLGHMHLHVDRIDRAQWFYCDVLGFDLVQRYGPSALFVSAGGYHHHIGLNTWAGVGAPPPAADMVGLVFYEIALPDAKTLEQVRERLQAAGVGFEEGSGLLDLRDPAGNGVRLIAEGV